jgi:hypothetical protein
MTTRAAQRKGRHSIRTILPALIAGLVVTAACDRPNRAIPTAPTVTAVPIAAAAAAPKGTPISVGQTVRATVTASDAPCDTHFLTDAPDPCLRYAVAPSASGRLRVRVTSAGPSWLTLRIGEELRLYGIQDVDGTVSVSAGAMYEVSVALHQAVAGNTSQPFELTTSLAP